MNEQLRAVDQAAKQAGGRIPMRRLNRDEYANTVRDLLKLDENVVRPLIEDLPPTARPRDSTDSAWPCTSIKRRSSGA